MCSGQQMCSLSDFAFDMELEEDTAPQCAHAESLMHSVWTASEAAAAHARGGWVCDLDPCDASYVAASQRSLTASPAARTVVQTKCAAASPASFQCVVDALFNFDLDDSCYQMPFGSSHQHQTHARVLAV